MQWRADVGDQTLNANLFADLLAMSESDDLDFKLEPYDLGQPGDDKRTKERKRAMFAKDLLAFANLWQDRPRYVVIGAKRLESGKMEAPGITAHVDGAELVNALDGFVHPCPRFHYVQVQHNGLQYGVIELLPDRTVGPFFAAKDVGGGDGIVEPILRKNALYCRRDSANVEASPPEQQAIWKWFQQGDVDPPAQFEQDEGWGRILHESQLSEINCHHVLILALDESSNVPELSYLGAVDWCAVFDLDPRSQQAGALRQYRELLPIRRALHVVKPDDKLVGDIPRTTTWYFVNDLQVGPDPVPETNYRDWVTRHGKSAAGVIERIAAACSGPTSVVALCESSRRAMQVRKLIEDFTSNFGDRITCTAIARTDDDWSTLEQHGLASLVVMDPKTFLAGLHAHTKLKALGTDNVVQLPGQKGVPIDVSGENLSYLEEDLELVHLGVGLRPENGAEPIRNFLRGNQISWFELGLQADVEREKARDLLRVVESDLDQRRSSRINIYHEPGSGGSTIARRVLWSVHRQYPTAILKRCSARETAERIGLIYQLTGHSLLILREGSDVLESESEQLADLLASKQIPCVLLQVLRRYQPPTIGSRSTFIHSQLSEGEAARFNVMLQREAPLRTQLLNNFATGPAASRTPFLFGLTAFAEDFTGLRSFVLNHLEVVSEPQIKVLQFLALAYDYGQQALTASHFARLLQLPPTRPVDFRRVLSVEALGLLVEVGRGRWRPMHQLVSTEILELTLSTNSNDTRLWKLRLADLAREFIDFCRTDAPVAPDDLQSVIEQVCVRRNDAELLSGVNAGENRFSRLVSDLPSTEAKLGLFMHLVDTFPDNPHFWAHLGRYHSIERRDFEEAERAIDHAILLNEGDHVLHHMKGMVLRNRAYQMIDEKNDLTSIVTTAKRASECFAEATRLAPNDEYGYIAEAQTLLKVVDYARGGKKAPLALANENADPWLRESFERVEDLLRTVREQRRGQMPSDHETRCRAELDVLYGAHDQALQRWDQLLQRKGPNGQGIVHAPPIRRQIVWLQLARCERRWDQLSPPQLKRSLDLLNENIQQEPNDDRNIRLWLQGARFLTPPPSISFAAERVATWRLRGDSLDANYYLYVVKTLEALDGSAIAANDAQRSIEICKNKAGFRRDRTRSFEWVGNGVGLRRLIHQDQLGGWDEVTDFWINTKPLLRLRGVVSRIHAPQSGEIELRWGMKAFFAPAKAGMSYGRDENRPVSFFLGFSYEGLRAWSVQPE